MNQYLEINTDNIAIGGVYDDAAGNTIPTNWKLLSGEASIGWVWDNDNSAWSTPTNSYLQIDTNGLAINGPFFRNPSVTLPSDWQLVTDSARVGWTYANNTWSAPVFVPVNVTVDEIRSRRDSQLSNTDWRDLPSYSGSDQAAWRTYRQELRDLPDGYIPTPYPIYPTEPTT
jgi:hypothetical protein